MATPQEVKEVIASNSTSKFFVEHHQYRSNHMTHGIVALARLGADKTRLQRFAAWYSDELESPDCSLAGEKSVVTRENIESMLGKKINFYGLFDFYKCQLSEAYEGDIERLIAAELPSIMAGWAGSALHGPIQTAYAFTANSAQGVLEGLTYLTFSYRPVVISDPGRWQQEMGKGPKDILDVLSDVRQNSKLLAKVREEGPKKNVNASIFGKRMAVLLDTEGDQLFDYAMHIKFPENLETCSTKWTRDIPRWILRCAIHVYAHSQQRNDFFLLHGLTSAWSLLQLSPLLPADADRRRAVSTFLCVLIAVYCTQDAPEMGDLPDRALWIDQSWDDVIADTLTSDREEHVFKVVQVCWEAAREARGDEVFDHVCRAAAYVVREFPYHKSRPAAS